MWNNHRKILAKKAWKLIAEFISKGRASLRDKGFDPVNGESRKIFED